MATLMMNSRLSTIIVSLSCFLVFGCTVELNNVVRTAYSDPSALPASEKALWLKAHHRDGRVAILKKWNVSDVLLTGDGVMLGADRDTLFAGAVSAPLDSIVLFETNHLVPSQNGAALTFMVGISAAVTAFCVVNPKACFGSCPTFYAATERGRELVAEGFSASVSPSLEATDLDALWNVRPSGGSIVLEMTNEALETHAVRHADLLAVPRREGERVLATADGRFRAATSIIAPTSCTAQEGDILDLVGSSDGVERSSLTDSTDLAVREIIDLSFDAVPTGSRLGLVLQSRQTLLSTYIFYHALSCLGQEAGALLASIKRGDFGGPGVLDRPGELLGHVEVQIPAGESGWRTVGELGETGPLAANVHVLELPENVDPSQLRLRLTRGHWRLDWVALAVLGEEREAMRLSPSEAWRDSVASPEDRAILADPARVLTTLPGDVVTLFYDVPPGDWELFLESRGWYLEWMREEWLQESDLPAAVRLFADPAGSLRELAPLYKAVEPEMEEIFWRSRFVRKAG